MLIPALILVVKIYKIIKFQDFPMLGSITAISLSLICLIGYFTTFIFEYVFYIYNPDIEIGQNYFRIELSFNSLAMFLLLSGFIFDLYKW